MLLGINENNEILAVDANLIGLTIIEVENETFAGVNPLLFKIETCENWQKITPRYSTQGL